MDYRRLQFVFLFICCLTTSAHLYTQDEQSSANERYDSKVDNASYEALSNQLDWSDTKKVLRLKEFEEDNDDDDKEVEKKRSTNKIGGFGFQILGYIAVIVLVGFILYLILGSIKINPRIDKEEFEITPLDEIEDIDIIDANQGLKDALEAGDYRLALGMHYILILQQLAAADRILWQPSKTNRDYIREMRKDPQGKSFTLVSRAYDLSLYGDRPFGVDQYEILLPELQLLSSPLIPVVDE